MFESHVGYGAYLKCQKEKKKKSKSKMKDLMRESQEKL